MKYFVTVNGNKYEVEVENAENEVAIAKEKPAATADSNSLNSAKESKEMNGHLIAAPMPGKILAIKVSEGETIKKDTVLIVLEAMKMENEIVSPKDGVVSGIFVSKDDMINVGDKLILIS